MGKSHIKIFISHRSTDKEIAEYIRNFLVSVGMPNHEIFCSSLPGNDVQNKISSEIKEAIKTSSIHVVILSKDYYDSIYCLNEAGIIWYLDNNDSVIVIGLPEICENNMFGFLNSEYKIRRLNNENDLFGIYDVIVKKLERDPISSTIVNRSVKKLIMDYENSINNRKEKEIEYKCIDDFTNVFYTDDEKIISYFVSDKQQYTFTKEEFKSWLIENEIKNVNLQNGFRLFEANGRATYFDDVLTLNISVFNEMMRSREKIKEDYKIVIENHTRLSVDRFKKIWLTSSKHFKMFFIYIKDNKLKELFSGWQSEYEKKNISDWEERCGIMWNLSEDYENILKVLIDNELVYATEYTNYGNPKKHAIYLSLLNYILSEDFDSNEVFSSIIEDASECIF